MLAIVIFCAAAGAGLLEQKPAGAINDFAGILSGNAKASLGQIAESLFRKTGVALVLVTTPGLDGSTIEETANRLFTRWGIGAKGKDEGVLILLALRERAVRIETGYGAEGYLTDAQSRRIIADASGYLSKGQWDEGLAAVYGACAALAAKAHNVDLSGIDGYAAPSPTAEASPELLRYKPNAFSVIFGALLLLFLVGTHTGRSVLMLLLLSFLFSGGRSGYHSAGFGGGCGRGGGFGGFGGGMSGGGGASGRF